MKNSADQTPKPPQMPAGSATAVHNKGLSCLEVPKELQEADQGSRSFHGSQNLPSPPHDMATHNITAVLQEIAALQVVAGSEVSLIEPRDHKLSPARSASGVVVWIGWGRWNSVC